ncbi:hypothetical protein [Amycolatopsis sp. BJA-103]|uniref:hypothetical protein n=1 Tax=Amycolatopsis sp. BJA-103 TaxID=1911175 RepID=UPI0011AFA188|nr:hypothetical protein [Amycolatopsis sp. BJA-103]
MSTMSRRVLTLLSVFLVMTGGAGPVPAVAQADPVAPTLRVTGSEKGQVHSSPAGAEGVGFGVTSDIPNLSLFQCVTAGCNEGHANQQWPIRDDLADICYFTNVNSPETAWHLVLDHNPINEVVGIVRSYYLQGTLIRQNCNTVGVGVTSDIPNLSLYQCPTVACNEGHANQQWPKRDILANICYLTNSDSPDGTWNLVLNQNPLNRVVGFVRAKYLKGTLTAQRC